MHVAFGFCFVMALCLAVWQMLHLNCEFLRQKRLVICISSICQVMCIKSMFRKENETERGEHIQKIGKWYSCIPEIQILFLSVFVQAVNSFSAYIYL